MNAGGQAEVRIHVYNPHAFPVDIATVDTSCPCLVLALPGRLVAPGEAIVIVARLDLRTKADFIGALAIVGQGQTATGQTAFHFQVQATVRESQP